MIMIQFTQKEIEHLRKKKNECPQAILRLEEEVKDILKWIGAYETTKGRKKDSSDFPDNFISLYANKKTDTCNYL